MKILFNKNISKWTDSKICTICNIEKQINNFWRKYSGRKDCKSRRGLKRYYDNKDKISNQRKLYYEKKNKDNLLKKQSDRFIHFKELVRICVELESRLKALQEN